MRQLLIYLLTFLMVAQVHRVQAQEGTGIRFAGYLERLPKPLPTISETMEAYGSMDQMDREMKYSNKEAQGSLTLLYTPLFELIKKRIAANEKSPLTGISKEERELLEGLKVSMAGLSNESQLNAFVVSMDHYRPLISSGKLSWTRINPAASVPVQKLYLQLKETEGQLDWLTFTKEAKSYYPSFGEIKDEKIKSEQKAFDEAFKKLPKKKVKAMEGFIYDVEDPEKAIPILEQHKKEAYEAFEQYYAKRYKWWAAQYKKLEAISQQIDKIALQAGSLVSSEADRSIQPALTDLQVRTWEAWQKLSFVTQGFFIDAAVTTAAKLQTEESIAIYQKYKESMQ